MRDTQADGARFTSRLFQEQRASGARGGDRLAARLSHGVLDVRGRLRRGHGIRATTAIAWARERRPRVAVGRKFGWMGGGIYRMPTERSGCGADGCDRGEIVRASRGRTSGRAAGCRGKIASGGRAWNYRDEARGNSREGAKASGGWP